MHNIGKKASNKTKKKMSESRMGKRVYRDNDRLNDSQVILVKKKLMGGMKPIEIANELNIPYKVINNIYSANSYRTVYVEGWDDFYNNRPKRNRSRNFTKEEKGKILQLHNDGLNNVEIAKIFNTDKSRIRQCIIRNK